MIGIDTNVLVRFVMQDDPKQAAQATKLIEGLREEAGAFVSVVVLVEMVWVFESVYELTRAQICSALHTLLDVDVFKVDRAAIVAAAIRAYEKSTADFADCMIARISAQAGCSETFTFDRKAAKSGGMVLIA